MTAGIVQARIVPMKPVGGAPDTLTPSAVSLSAIAGSTRTVTNLLLPSGAGSLSVPAIVSASMTTSAILLPATSCSNSL